MSPYRFEQPLPPQVGPLRVDGDAPLPAVCLKCATAERLVGRNARLRMRTQYTLPLCQRCDERRENARKGLVFATVFAVGGVLGSPLNARRDSDLYGVPIVSLVAFALVFFFAIRPRMLRVRETREGAIELRDVHPAAADAVRRTAGRMA